MTDTCSKNDLTEYKALIDQAFLLRDKALEDYKNNQDEKIDDSRDNLDRRLAELNELRKQVTEDRGLFVRNDVYDSKHEILANQYNGLDKRVTQIEGITKGHDKNWANNTVIITMAIAVIALLINGIRLLVAHQ